MLGRIPSDGTDELSQTLGGRETLSRHSVSKSVHMAWGGGGVGCGFRSFPDRDRNCVCPAACAGAAAACCVPTQAGDRHEAVLIEIMLKRDRHEAVLIEIMLKRLLSIVYT